MMTSVSLFASFTFFSNLVSPVFCFPHLTVIDTTGWQSQEESQGWLEEILIKPFFLQKEMIESDAKSVRSEWTVSSPFSPISFFPFLSWSRPLLFVLRRPVFNKLDVFVSRESPSSTVKSQDEERLHSSGNFCVLWLPSDVSFFFLLFLKTSSSSFLHQQEQTWSKPAYATNADAGSGGWKSWILPFVIGLAATLLYRYYLSYASTK